MSTKKLTNETNATTATELNIQPEPEVKNSNTTHNRPEDYSSSSLIARAYSAGFFPSFTHQRLFNAILAELNGKNEGRVDFVNVLEATGMHRSSALQIIRHMVNFGILEVSFNSSHVIGEGRKSWVSVKIIKNLECKKDTELPKSA